jgi:iron complex transport system ATP-binding protein
MSDVSSSPAFMLRDLAYRYAGAPARALEGITLDVHAHEFTAIIGPNGAGKSTLVRVMGGLLTPTDGSVECLERPLHEWDRRALARRLAVVAQEPAPIGTPLTVRDYVQLGRNPHARVWAPLSARDDRIVDEALEQTRLNELQDRALTELSGGERQRTKLARAFAQEPNIILLDEPTAHLDLHHALWTFSFMKHLVQRSGVTIICVTHDMNLASRHADKMALVSGGGILSWGDPGEVLSSSALSEAYECNLQVEVTPGLGYYVLPTE